MQHHTMLQSMKLFEVTLSPLSPAWLPVITQAGGDLPQYLTEKIASAKRVHLFVVWTDADRTVVVLPGRPGTFTLPTVALEDVVELPMVKGNNWDGLTWLVAEPVSLPGARLLVLTDEEMLGAQVTLISAELALQLGKGFPVSP